METKPLVIERTYNAPVKRVWEAITDKDKMKQWYFNLDAFKPEVGFEFRFYGGSKEKQYLHICVVREVVVEKKISYSWRYDTYPGESLVTWELFPDGKDRTTLKLTHTGLETFPQDTKDFAKESFTKGWTQLVGTSLKDFVEKA